MFRNLLRWARITKAGENGQQFFTQQMEYLGKTSDGVIIYPYGIHGNAPIDCLALMMSVQGNADNRAAIAWDAKNRPDLEEGEVAFYHPPTKGFIIWRKNGDLDIDTGQTEGAKGSINVICRQANIAASESLNIESPETTIDGNFTVNGTMTNNGKDVGDTHRHSQANDSDGNTEQDISGVL